MLSSMGLLSVLNDNFNLDVVFNSFLSWVETYKNVSNFIGVLADIGINSILNNAKMALSDVVNYFDEFYDDFVEDNSKSYIKTDSNTLVTDVITLDHYNKNKDRYGNLFYNDNFSIDLGSDIFDIEIKYSVKPEDWIAEGWVTRMEFIIYQNGVRIGGLLNGFSNAKFLDSSIPINLIYTVDYVVNNNSIRFSNTVLDYLSGKIFVENNTYEVDLNNYTEIVPDYLPSISYYPDDLALPWELGLNIDSQIGSTVDILLDNINVKSDDYTGLILEKGQSWVNEKEANKVITEDVEGSEVVADVEVGASTGTGEGALDLEGIKALIQSILNFLQNIFSIPDTIDINWNPLLNINFEDKFPFCLPWDLYNMVDELVDSGEPPNFIIDIKGNTIDISFEQFELFARISRYFTLLIFTVSLIIITKRLID